MRLFYTGAKAYNLEQKESSLSLGGYISSTRVPNNVLGNLFDSTFWIQKNECEYRCLILKSESDRKISVFSINGDSDIYLPNTEVELTVPEERKGPRVNPQDVDPEPEEIPNFLVRYEFAFDGNIIEEAREDDVDKKWFKVDGITTPSEEPYLEFSAGTEEEPVVYPKLEAGKYLALWIKRVVYLDRTGNELDLKELNKLRESEILVNVELTDIIRLLETEPDPEEFVPPEPDPRTPLPPEGPPGSTG